MTQDQEVMKNDIDRLRQRLKDLLSKCTHCIVDQFDDALCEVCDRVFGWWCPTSPDHCCHYTTESVTKDGEVKRYVQLFKGDKDFNFPKENYDPESDDCCLYCGEPKERN